MVVACAFWEVINGDVAVGRLDAGADVNAKLDGQQEGAEGFTALMWAAYGGHRNIVELLIAKGASLESKSDRGYTPLILAATSGSVELIDLFLSQVGPGALCARSSGWEAR